MPDVLAGHADRLRTLDPLLGTDPEPPADGEPIDVGRACG